MLEIANRVDENQWHEFLLSQSEATLYHTPEWKVFLEKTFDYKPHYLFATDESDRLTGVLPLFQVKSRLTGNRLCSVPFSHVCGCLGDKNTCSALLVEAIAIATRHHIEQIEIRNTVEISCFQEMNAFCTHVLGLSQNAEDTWKQLDKGSVRWAVKKAERLGVSVVSSTNLDDLREFYELNCITKQSLGVPCHPWKFFKNLFSILDGYVRMYLAQRDGNIVAGGVMEYYKDRVLYGYGAADPDHLNLHPYNAFIWKSIEEACAKGYRIYDFGRTSYDNTGLIQFKRKWGVQEKRLMYSFFPEYSKSAIIERDSIMHQLGSSATQTMPRFAYKTFSTLVFPHLG